MYHQVLIDESHRDFQLMLWRQNPGDDIKICRLNTVTYGTSSAPFSAIGCLTHLSDLYKVIRSDFHVDDLLTGADNFEDLSKIRDQAKEIFSSFC